VFFKTILTVGSLAFSMESLIAMAWIGYWSFTPFADLQNIPTAWEFLGLVVPLMIIL
jgi:hypothetical protein